MSESEKPEFELDLDLQLLPAWARQPQAANRYAQFEESGDRGDRRGPRGRGPGGPGGPRGFRGPGGPGGPPGMGGRRDGGPRGDRRGGDGRPGGGPRRDGPGGGPGGGDRPGFGRGGGGPRRGGPREGDRDRGPRRDPVEELPEGITLDIAPDPAGVESLTRQIRQTGRAYPLFDIGHLILKRPDRYLLEFRATGNLPDGTARQLFVCNLDDTVWLSEGDAVRHVLTKHFDAFYQTDRIAVDPPKGTYTFVAQCGISGVILGPPNLHDYQAKLQRLHSERFSRMPFDMYKSRIRIVRDEAVVKQWVEQQSFKNEYTCLNVPEPLKLGSREAVEKHFRDVHLSNIVHPAASHVVKTPAAREALQAPLRRLARREFDLQQRFPLKLVTRLSDEFAHRGLHFFKVNKTVLHVAVARPRYLDLETNPVGEGIRKIIGAIESTPDCTRRKLFEKLGVALPQSGAPGAPAAAAPAPAPAEGDAAAAPAAAPAAPAEPSAELQALVTDLHWLIHEGHVIEFANGRMEAAKKPAPRPQPAPRPPKAPKAAPAGGAPAAAAPAAPAATEAAPAAPEGEGSSIESVEGSLSAAVAETAPAPVEPEPEPETPAAPADDESKINPS